MSIRVLLADKEAIGREHLRRLLQVEPEVRIVAECVSGTEALEAIEKNEPNLVFLDVELPELDGFSVVEALRPNRLPAVVFLGVHNEFALRAYETQAADYLLKPYNVHRFQVALRRAMDWLRNSSELGKPRPPDARTNLTQDFPERIAIKSRGKISILKSTEIHWVRTADNYVELNVGSKVHLIRLSMQAIAEKLSPHRFVRISRSILVNADRIKEILPRTHGDYFVLMDCGTRLAGSRTYRRQMAKFVEHHGSDFHELAPVGTLPRRGGANPNLGEVLGRTILNE